ncbi:MAG: MFS transporter [Anaerolineales bacterium]
MKNQPPQPETPSAVPHSGDHAVPFWFQLFSLTFIRTFMYTGHRLVFPFLPVIARGLGVNLGMVALAVSIRSGLGIFSPLLGRLSDQKGRKAAMLIGLLLFSVSSLIIAFLPTYSAFLIGLSLIWVGVIIFDPAIQAYVGERVAFERRARAIAILEFGWSGAFLIGIPLVGILLARGRWNDPFLWLAGLGGLGTVFIWKTIPKIKENGGQRFRLLDGLQHVVSHPPAVGGLLVSLLLVMANQAVLIIYGAWLENTHKMTPKMLGRVSSVIGVAGIVGLVAVVAISDKVGKRRAIAAGILLNVAAAVSLTVFTGSVATVVALLFVFFLSFEFSFVTGISLITELRPRARATMMAFNTAAISLGDAFGAFVGSRVYTGDITANVLLTVVLNLVVFVVLISLVHVEYS